MFIPEFSTVGVRRKRRRAPQGGKDGGLRTGEGLHTIRCLWKGRALLLQYGAGGGAAGAAGVVVDDAALIGTEHPLTGGADGLGSTSD